MLRLIINADDFGLSEGVNDAVEELAAERVLSSTTVMVNMPATRGAARLIQYRDLSIGLHFNLTEGPSICAPSQVPSLVDQHGNFHGQKKFHRRLVLGLVSDQEVQAELNAQYQKLSALVGSRVSHVDTHQNIHKTPFVARSLMRFLKLNPGIGIRSPARYVLTSRMGAWSIRSSVPESVRRGNMRMALGGCYLHLLSRRFRKICFAPAGELHVPTLKKLDLLASLARSEADGLEDSRIFEIACHPAASLAGLSRSKLIEKRLEEYAILGSPSFKAMLKLHTLIPYPTTGLKSTQ